MICKGIFHRDIKPENILIESSTDVGRGLKLADFGSCRGIYSKQPYTEYISTRWYRAPECLLTDGYYGPEMDLWGAGCVMFEITSLYPLFPGSNEIDQVTRIHKVLGAPTPEIIQKFRSKGTSHISLDFPPQKGVGIPQLIPHASPDCIDLIVKLLKYDATERITAREAMRHPYFRDLKDTDKKGSVPSGGTEKASVKNEGSDSISVESDIEVSKGSLGGQAQKGASQIGKAVPGQPQAAIIKALPNIPKKGVGTGVESIQKHTQQQQNFLMKASASSSVSKMNTAEVATAASTLPPISSNVIPVGKGGMGQQYGSTVGANTSNKQQQKPLWQQRRKKSKAKFAGTGPQVTQGSSGPTGASSQQGGAIAQYLQDRLNGTGGGFIYQQGQQRSQAANAYGAVKTTSVAGKVGGSSKPSVSGAGTKYYNYKYISLFGCCKVS
jgi:serine/threonine protein kinase